MIKEKNNHEIKHENENNGLTQNIVGYDDIDFFLNWYHFSKNNI